jgi:hypothetical protein
MALNFESFELCHHPMIFPMFVPWFFPFLCHCCRISTSPRLVRRTHRRLDVGGGPPRWMGCHGDFVWGNSYLTNMGYSEFLGHPQNQSKTIGFNRFQDYSDYSLMMIWGYTHWNHQMNPYDHFERLCVLLKYAVSKAGDIPSPCFSFWRVAGMEHFCPTLGQLDLNMASHHYPTDLDRKHILGR